jgi:transcriptional regulator with XRE-family HTH domain
MKLGLWLKRNNIGVDDFSRRIGVSGTAVYRYISGDRAPGPTTLSAIFKKTGGAVTPNDFFLDATGKKWAFKVDPYLRKQGKNPRNT